MTTHLAQTRHSFLSAPSPEHTAVASYNRDARRMFAVSCQLPDIAVRPQPKSDHFNEFQYKSYGLMFRENLVIAQQTNTDKFKGSYWQVYVANRHQDTEY
jgi:hypothetical protein